MDIKALLDIVQTAGALGLLVVIVISGMKRVWIWRWAHEEQIHAKDDEIAALRAEKEELWLLLKETVGLVQTTTVITEQATRVARDAVPAAARALPPPRPGRPRRHSPP